MRKLILLTTILTLAAVGAIGSVATAQDGQMDQKAMEQLMMKLATPGPAHALLHKLEGKWETAMTSYMDGSEPVTSTGTMSFGPMEIPTRSETIFVDDDKVTFTMWHTMNGQEKKAMEITYTRVR